MFIESQSRDLSRGVRVCLPGAWTHLPLPFPSLRVGHTAFHPRPLSRQGWPKVRACEVPSLHSTWFACSLTSRDVISTWACSRQLLMECAPGRCPTLRGGAKHCLNNAIQTRSFPSTEVRQLKAIESTFQSPLPCFLGRPVRLRSAVCAVSREACSHTASV